LPVPRPGMARGGLTFNQWLRIRSIQAEEDYSTPAWHNEIASFLLALDSDSHQEVLGMVDILKDAGFTEDAAKACIVMSWDGDYRYINSLLYTYLFQNDLPLIKSRELLRLTVKVLRERLDGKEGLAIDRPMANAQPESRYFQTHADIEHWVARGIMHCREERIPVKKGTVAEWVMMKVGSQPRHGSSGKLADPARSLRRIATETFKYRDLDHLFSEAEKLIPSQ
jgi:hypothetical protein